MTAIASLRDHAEAIRAGELERAEAKLAVLTAEQRAAVEAVTERIVDELLPVLDGLFALEPAA